MLKLKGNVFKVLFTNLKKSLTKSSETVYLKLKSNCFLIIIVISA